MLRPLAALLALLTVALAACGGDDGASQYPTPSAAPTATRAVVDCPHASLILNGAERYGTLNATSWGSRDCAKALTPHPAGEITIDLGGLGLSGDVGLLVTPEPDGLRVVAWEPESVSAQQGAPLQISIAVPAVLNRRELAVEPVERQTLALGELPPGDYVVEVTGEWPAGAASFAFYVDMLSPGSTLELPDHIGGPAAGVCAIPGPDIPVVTIELQPAIPSPRCVALLPGHRLEVVNLRDSTQNIRLGAFQATLQPGESAVSDLVAGDFLAPGHHTLKATGSGAEVILLASEIAAGP